MQTLCLASLSSGGLGCGDGLYKPGAVLTVDADAGGEGFQTEVLPSDSAPEVLPPQPVKKVVGNGGETLEVGAAQLVFVDNSFSADKPASVKLEAIGWETAKAWRGAIGPVYRITFDKPPPSTKGPTFIVDPVEQGKLAKLDEEFGSPFLPPHVAPSQLDRALTLAFLKVGVEGNNEWVRLPTDPDAIQGLRHSNFNLVPYGDTPEMIVGLVLSCDRDPKQCMDVFGVSCEAFCKSNDSYNCGTGSMCQ